MQLTSTGALQWALWPSTGSWVWTDVNYTVPINQWTHVAWVYNGSNSLIYINGTLVQTYPFTSGVTDMGTTFRIGDRSGIPNGTNAFVGLIDEMKLWNEAISQSNIQAWMYKAVTSSHPNVTPTNNMVAY